MIKIKLEFRIAVNIGNPLDTNMFSDVHFNPYTLSQTL